MYDKIKGKWLPNYNYKSIGMSHNKSFVQTTDDETLFMTEFINPIQTLSGVDVVPDELVAEALMALSKSEVKCWYHCLSTIAKAPFLSKGSTLAESIQKSCDAFLRKAVPVYAMCVGGNTFATYTVDGSIVGEYPVTVCVLGPCDKFKKYVPEIRELVHKDPTTLPDATLAAIKNAVDAGIVNDTALRSVMYPIPDYDTGRVINTNVKATTPNMPGYFVRKLITSLPKATVNNSKSPYHAALEFAYQNPVEYRSAIAELERILTDLGDDTLQMSAAEVAQMSNGVDISGLNRDNVMEWLHVTYGISYDNLNNILIPTADKTFSSPLLVDGAKDMSAQQLMDAMQDAPVGYMDDIIKAYLNEIGMSDQCTIAQLIQSVEDGGVKLEPIPFAQQVADYASVNKISFDTTVDELVTGSEHKPVSMYLDKKAITLEMLRGNKRIEDKLCAHIEEALENPDKGEMVRMLNVGSAVRAAARPFVSLDAHDVSDAIVREYLCDKGMNTHDAEYVAKTGKLPEHIVTEEEAVHYVHNVTNRTPEDIKEFFKTKHLPLYASDLDDAVVTKYLCNKKVSEEDATHLLSYGYTPAKAEHLNSKVVSEYLRSRDIPEKNISALFRDQKENFQLLVGDNAAMISYLKDHGVEDMDAHSIVEKGHPTKYYYPDSSHSASEFLIRNGMDPDAADYIVRNFKLPESSVSSRPESLQQNFGYKVGEQILADTRTVLQNDDSFAKHDEMRPVMACFMRLLMCFMKDKQDILDGFKERAESATGDAKRIIEDAITTLSE